MASTSSVQRRFEYDVFLSFRGEDTRKTFVDHLYRALVDKGFNTYKDDEKIEKGENISEQLIRSIKDSRLYLIIFSKNYANSSWCLNELVKIMECQSTSEQTAYPIFYDVEPTEVRNLSGAVGKAFAKHKEKEDAGRWKDALKEAADLAGLELKTDVDGYEAKFIKKIIEDISPKLRFNNLSFDKNLVGMEIRVEKIVSSLKIGFDDVLMIGIWGIGGGGKTTLATAVYDHISNYNWFEGKSLVENVREVSKGSGLKKLQKQILRDVLNDESIKVRSVHDGTNTMKKMMGSRKVLIVLDDVDNIEQLEALAGEPNWFKPGSRIIITTRDDQVLISHKVHRQNIHKVNLLSNEEAICLFNRRAFEREVPTQEYKELSRKVIHYADGLPLTIRVLGSFLCGRPVSQWEDTIESLKTIPEDQTLKRLELSYDGLANHQKEMFLDVACILKGMLKREAITIFKSCGSYAEIGLSVLEQKSLITISDGGYLSLHDLIAEMGWNIVRRSHRHSRLWIGTEIEDILTSESGTEATRSIILKYTNLHPAVIMRGLTKLKELRFLHVTFSRYFNVDEVNKYLPDALRYLCWPEYQFSCLPETFGANNLVNLQMGRSRMFQLWEGGERKVLNKLRFLNLSHSRFETFDLELTPLLEKLDLSSSYFFSELHMPIKGTKLKFLNLSGTKVSNLNLSLTPLLEKLDLSSSYLFSELHMPIECPELKFLNLSDTKVSNLNLRLTPLLEELDLSSCHLFVELDMPIECPKLKFLNLSGTKVSNLNIRLTPLLEKLDLSSCNLFVELDMPIECPKLKFLNLSGTKVSNLNLRLAPLLEKLDLSSCHFFVEFHMPIECPKLKFLNLSGTKASKLNLSLTPLLETLDLGNCYNLQEIYTQVGCLKMLVYLNLSGCLRFKYFKVDKEHEPTSLDSATTLELIAKSVDICELHPNSTLPKFQFKCSYGEPLPLGSGNIEKLISFGLCACTNLESFSSRICGLQRLKELTFEGSIPEVLKDLWRLEHLEKLSLCMGEIKHLPDSICTLKHLKSLKLKSCWFLEQLPQDLVSLQCLQELHLIDCISLQDIPESMCEMKCLKYLHLAYCSLVEKLPEELGNLTCLKELNIEGSGISLLPRSIHQMKGLRIVWSKVLLESHGFTLVSNISRYTASYCQL